MLAFVQNGQPAKKGDPTFADRVMANHPVVCVNWEEAQNYCQWVGARLPTEAEWEYAFRGEKRSIYSWGDEFDGNRLNYCDQNCSQSHADDGIDDGYPQTAPVGSYPTGASWSGVYNLSGNVSEWVSDWLGEYTSDAISNPSGPPSGAEKMIRGCSWFFHPTYCRGAVRSSVDPYTRFEYLGFRCASNLPISSAAILVTAIVFGASHINATYDFPGGGIIFGFVVFVLGVIGAYAMLKDDSLIGPVLFHAGYDLLVIVPVLNS